MKRTKVMTMTKVDQTVAKVQGRLGLEGDKHVRIIAEGNDHAFARCVRINGNG